MGSEPAVKISIAHALERHAPNTRIPSLGLGLYDDALADMIGTPLFRECALALRKFSAEIARESIEKNRREVQREGTVIRMVFMSTFASLVSMR